MMNEFFFLQDSNSFHPFFYQDNEDINNIPSFDLSLSHNDSNKYILKQTELLQDQIRKDFFHNSQISEHNSIIELNPKDEKNNNKEINNTSDKETRAKTNQKESEIVKVISKDNDKIKQNYMFDVKIGSKGEVRLDYVIKDIKVYISKYMKDYGNELIKKCKFENRLKKAKLFAPSYKYFTGNSNFRDNTKFLNFTVEEIFTFPDKKVEKNDNRLQSQNKDIIKDIKDHIEEKYTDNIPEACQKMLEFFKMSFEDIIILFYESEYFTQYCNSGKAKRNEYFFKAKGYSLLEKNAFIKLIKSYK